MARPVKRHLMIGAVPYLDETELLVRMHEEDVPRGVKWGRYIHMSANDSHITAKVFSNAMAEIEKPRMHQISLNKHLRDRLEVKPGTTVDFYLSKASRLKAPYYLIRYHPVPALRRRVLLKTLGWATILVAIVAVVALYFVQWS